MSVTDLVGPASQRQGHDDHRWSIRYGTKIIGIKNKNTERSEAMIS